MTVIVTAAITVAPVTMVPAMTIARAPPRSIAPVIGSMRIVVVVAEVVVDLDVDVIVIAPDAVITTPFVVVPSAIIGGQGRGAIQIAGTIAHVAHAGTVATVAHAGTVGIGHHTRQSAWAIAARAVDAGTIVRRQCRGTIPRTDPRTLTGTVSNSGIGTISRS